MKYEMPPLERLKLESNRLISMGALLSTLVLPGCGRKEAAPNPEAVAAVTQYSRQPDSLDFEFTHSRYRGGNWTLRAAAEAPTAYHQGDIWYNRLRYLEALCATNAAAAPGLLQNLDRIQKQDPDSRVGELAGKMVQSATERGDFKDTEPYEKRRAEDRRLTMQLNPANPFKPEAIWYDRQTQLEHFARSYSDKSRPDWVATDLRTISDFDDDWRIAELAQRLLQAAEKHQSFAKVEL